MLGFTTVNVISPLGWGLPPQGAPTGLFPVNLITAYTPSRTILRSDPALKRFFEAILCQLRVSAEKFAGSGLPSQ